MAWKRGQSRTSTAQWKRTRRQALLDSENCCSRCGVDGDEVKLQVDHVISHEEGKRRGLDLKWLDSIENAQVLCVRCHRLKTKAETQRGVDRYQQRRTGKRPKPQHPSDAYLWPQQTPGGVPPRRRPPTRPT
jgi:5-methylcytosine-specific restriction endonuclease McrA